MRVMKCILMSLIPATLFVVLGYIILVSAGDSEGGLQSFGQALAVWVFILATLTVLAGAGASLFGGRHRHGRERTGRMNDYMDHMRQLQETQVALLEKLVDAKQG